MESNSAPHGRGRRAAQPQSMMLDTSARATEQPPMEPRDALEHRKQTPQMPYKVEAWKWELIWTGALKHFAKILEGLLKGFKIDFPPLATVQIPPNKDSVTGFKKEFSNIIQKELDKGRYIGPFQAKPLEVLIRPFQSSPMSIIPKPCKPGKFRLIQNFSYLNSPHYPFLNPSINSHIDSNNFPTTWG
jgi:hypothetical protein